MNELLIKQVVALAKELYGESRHQIVLRHNAARMTAGDTTDITTLDEDQLQTILDGLKRLNSKITRPR